MRSTARCTRTVSAPATSEVLDVLVSSELAHEGGHCRVQNIADRVHLSQSALSRLIGRLEKDGLVERTVLWRDRRGVWVALTRKGRDLHAEGAPATRRAGPHAERLASPRRTSPLPTNASHHELGPVRRRFDPRRAHRAPGVRVRVEQRVRVVEVRVVRRGPE